MGRRDDDEFEIEDRRRESYVSGGGSGALEIPTGLSFLKMDWEGSKLLEFIPFKVTEAHLKFSSAFPKNLQFSRPGKWYPERTYFRHENVGPDNGRYACPYMNFGKKCPICEERSRLAKSPNPIDKKAAEKLRPKERQLFLVMLRDQKSGRLEDGIKLIELSTAAFGKQLDAFIQNALPRYQEAYSQYYHPLKGLTVQVVGAKEKMKNNDTGEGSSWNKYTPMRCDQREDPIPREVFDHGFDLDAMVREVSYETLRKAFYGLEEEGQDEDREIDNYVRRQEVARENGPELNTEPKREPTKAEPKKSEPIKVDGFASKDIVTFDRKGDKLEGEIIRIDKEKETATVYCEDRGREYVLDFEEMKVVKRDTTFDAKPEPAKTETKKPARGWEMGDEDEQDDRVVNRTTRR